MALVAGAPHALFQRLAEFAEAAAFVAMGEILGEIAEAYRIDEARQLDIGALDETPKAGDSADAEQAGEQPRRAETFEAERPDEQERRPHQRHPPPQPQDEAALKAHHVFPGQSPGTVSCRPLAPALSGATPPAPLHTP